MLEILFVHTIWALLERLITFYRTRWIQHTVHWTSSAMELCLHCSTASLKNARNSVVSIGRPMCHPLSSYLAAVELFCLPTRLQHHQAQWPGMETHVSSPTVWSIYNQSFLNTRATFCAHNPVEVWPPINAFGSFINSANLSGGKGHSRSHWWDKIRLRKEEMVSKRGYTLHTSD